MLGTEAQQRDAEASDFSAREPFGKNVPDWKKPRLSRPSPQDQTHRPKRPKKTASKAPEIPDVRSLAPRPQIREQGTPARSKSVGATEFCAAISRNLIETFLPPLQHERDHDAVVRRLWTKGWFFVAVFVGLIGLWAVVADISSAVIGSGQFVVDTSVKKVQHPTGGVVGELRVQEGAFVQQGELLLRLDDTVIRSNLQVIVKQLDELFGRRARLVAERGGRATVETPKELAARQAEPNVARVIADEKNLFEARRKARAGRRAQLAKRITQLQNEITGLRSQVDASAREATFIANELKGVRELYGKKLVPLMRLNALERQAANLDGRRGQQIASIAQTEGKIAEAELQIIQIEDDLRASAQKELREGDAKIAELLERRVAAEDQLRRVDITAPISGHVHQLAVHTVGGVITAAEPVMLIVPAYEELVIEAKVTPQDRDRLQLGQATRVRIHSSDRRNTPELRGILRRISANVAKDPNSLATFYSIWVAVPKTEIAQLRDISIVAGMQAEVFVEAGARSPLQFLLQPLSDQIARAFRER